MRTFTPPPAVLSATVTAPAATPAVLPFTGGELVALLPLALSAVALGAVRSGLGRVRADPLALQLPSRPVEAAALG